MKVNKFMKKKDVPFQDTTAGSLNNNVTEIIVEKCSPFSHLPSLLGSFRKRVNTVSSRCLAWYCTSILVHLDPSVSGEIPQHGWLFCWGPFGDKVSSYASKVPAHLACSWIQPQLNSCYWVTPELSSVAYCLHPIGSFQCSSFLYFAIRLRDYWWWFPKQTQTAALLATGW